MPLNKQLSTVMKITHYINNVLLHFPSTQFKFDMDVTKFKHFLKIG